MIESLISSILAVRDASVNAAWSPFVQLCRAICLSVLSRIQIGQIQILDVNGDVVTIGEITGAILGPRCVLNIHNDTFWLRLALYGDMV
jgi:hypothetical protein